MRRWSLAALAVLFLFGLFSIACANLAPPFVPPPPAGMQRTKLVVVEDANAKIQKLVIPRSLLGPPKKADAGVRVPTIVAGVALTLAIASSGFWFIRRGPGRSAAAAVVVLALFALGVSSLYADIPFPRQQPETTAIKLPANIPLQEDVIIEIVEKGDAIKLIVAKPAEPRQQ